MPGLCESCKQYSGIAHTPDGDLCNDCLLRGVGMLETEIESQEEEE